MYPALHAIQRTAAPDHLHGTKPTVIHGVPPPYLSVPDLRVANVLTKNLFQVLQKSYEYSLGTVLNETHVYALLKVMLHLGKAKTKIVVH